MITSEDIEMTRGMMSRMLRSFDANVGDGGVGPGSQKRRAGAGGAGGVAADKTAMTRAKTADKETKVQRHTRGTHSTTRITAMQASGRLGQTECDGVGRQAAPRAGVGSGLQTPQDTSGLPLFPDPSSSQPGGLTSPATHDTKTKQRTTSQSKSEEWIDTFLAASSPSLMSLCDVKLLVTPAMPALSTLSTVPSGEEPWGGTVQSARPGIANLPVTGLLPWD